MHDFFILALGIATGYAIKGIRNRINGPKCQGGVVVKQKLDRLLSFETPHTRHWLLIEMGLDCGDDRQTLHSLLHDYEDRGSIERTDTPEGPAYKVRALTHA